MMNEATGHDEARGAEADAQRVDNNAGDPTEAISGGGALLLAQLRACGQAPVLPGGQALREAAMSAAAVDRRLGEIDDAQGGSQRVVVLGWAEGAAPDPDQHPSSSPRTLAAVPYLVWGACLAAAWPNPVADAFPGQPFSRQQILLTCTRLGAPKNAVVGALDKVLPASGLIAFTNGYGVLGPAAAALPVDTWAQLRRIHDQLPRGSSSASPSEDARLSEESTVGMRAPLRWLPGPPTVPFTANDNAVKAIVTALEAAEGVVTRADLPMLGDPAVRASVERALAGCGRVLISVADRGWTTGYPDEIARALAAHGLGSLTTNERAVLALVLLYAVAIPRARGLHHDDSWVSDHSVGASQLAKNRHLSQTEVKDAIRGLRRSGFVDVASSGGYIPGPAMARLTLPQRTALWEDLIVLGRPNGYMAERVLQRRQQTVASLSNMTTAVANRGQESS